MQTSFDQTVAQKSKDELVRILINKEEYKTELVLAAERELKLRDSQKNSSAPQRISVLRPPLGSSEVRETPLGVYLAGLLMFIVGPFWLSIGFLQAGATAITDDPETGILSFWNILIGVLIIVFGIGTVKGKKWGYGWGLASSIIGILWFGYLYSDSEAIRHLYPIGINIIVAIALMSNRNHYYRTPVPCNAAIEAPRNPMAVDETNTENQDYEYRTRLIRLNQMVVRGQRSLFGTSEGDQIRSLTIQLADTNENARHLLHAYQQLFNADLLADLKGLSSNYASIKAYLKPFIDHGLVDSEYPHDRLAWDS